ncbi:glycosyltransferase [Planococcus lenghuensis]|uniref:Glycosyl transferase family 1 n=1 Tax=Planococcus lenghuensis TaxID=2213202 RepID=A0A1Q2L442_9BACL|nr:glycosyltransferase [Planococcus lenghuensis]AQQ55144.1 glycosyl transferase family 1 [Planococcus lenghuensis]
MVFDVPAEKGGALSILNEFYERAIKDKENDWFFVVSTPKLPETSNTKVLQYSWVKRSWFHRLYFDHFIAPKLVSRYKISEVLSLQNLIIPKVKTKQVLYLHQPLPFIEKKYKINENFKFWVYQNIIGKMIFSSIKKADKVKVQTNWIKKACIEKTKEDESKFELQRPKIDVKIKNYYKDDQKKETLFFYPANAIHYKNHDVIVQAVKILKERKIENFKVIFTLTGEETNFIKSLFKDVENNHLPIIFIGGISREEVFQYYSKSILIFPSYVETFGLPLLEAKMHRTPIIASDCAFSHEILDDYKNVTFFNPFNGEELASNMSKNLSENAL